MATGFLSRRRAAAKRQLRARGKTSMGSGRWSQRRSGAVRAGVLGTPLLVLVVLLGVLSTVSWVSAGEINLSSSQFIEIDGSGCPIAQGANQYPASVLPSAVCNGGNVDWVVDSEPNTDTPNNPLAAGSDGIAVGINPGISGVAGGKGHWYGKRIIDGLNQADQNIFLTGGKENDLSTWNVGPGSVGSDKYELSQAYIALRNDAVNPGTGEIYFAMERSGNNGTTAFDFEFNQLPPDPNDPRNQTSSGLVIPTRTVGDVLFTFEMKGSGTSGSATPNVFTWNGSAYVPGTPQGVVTSINNHNVNVN